jgi:hypothetical protein
MGSMRSFVSLSCGLCCAPAALAADVDPRELSNLFLVFLFLFSVLYLLSSLPRAPREDVVSPEILRAFAHSKGLSEEKVKVPERLDLSREAIGRWRTDNPAAKRPPPGTWVFRGDYDGREFFIDEVWMTVWRGLSRQREPLLRMAIGVRDLPPSLEVSGAGRWEVLTGRAGLIETRSKPPRRGRLVASFSKRPVLRAKERIYLSDARRRILEEYEERVGGLRIRDGRVFVIRRRHEITGPELLALHEHIGELARRLEAEG